ncbi:MAG: hypothetical protein WAV40_00495 [Microgenomates group bacterium]
MQKKLYFIPFIALIFATSVAQAVSPSPTQSPLSSPDDTVINENLKKRLKESLGEVDEPSDNSPKNLGYIGKIKDIIKDTVIMEDKDGQKDIKLAENTVIVRAPGSATIKREDMRIDDYIIAIGTPIEPDVLGGKRLIVSVDPLPESTKSSGMGSITKIGKSSLTVTENGSEKSITLNSKTRFKSPVATIELADLSVGDTVLFTLIKDANDNLLATVIMRIKTAAIDQ